MSGGYYNAQGKYILSKEEFVELILREQAIRKKRREREAEEKERLERIERIKRNRGKGKEILKLKEMKKNKVINEYVLKEKARKDGNIQLSFCFD